MGLHTRLKEHHEDHRDRRVDRDGQADLVDGVAGNDSAQIDKGLARMDRIEDPNP